MISRQFFFFNKEKTLHLDKFGKFLLTDEINQRLMCTIYSVNFKHFCYVMSYVFKNVDCIKWKSRFAASVMVIICCCKLVF